MGVEAFGCCQANDILGTFGQLFFRVFDDAGGFNEIIAGEGAEVFTGLAGGQGVAGAGPVITYSDRRPGTDEEGPGIDQPF